jgi:hypothetical protein
VDFYFKGLIARRVYKTFGVKRSSMLYLQDGAQFLDTRGTVLKCLVTNGFPVSLFKMLLIYIPRSEPG